MSVLSFPRIYFKGWMQWDPCTVNNNDYLFTYDGARASLNWPFLVTTGPAGGITQQNFQTTFRPWLRTYQPDTQGGIIPAEWNIFGSHSVTFLQNGGDQSTVVTGGATGPNGVITSGDPLIGGALTLIGDSQPPVMVDTNPSAYWATQIFWSSISIGSGAAAITGTRSFRMHSRWLNFFRIYNSANATVQAAAAIACCFQTAIPFADVQWPERGASQLADSLQDAASTAQGIMIRFTAYVNLYNQNGLLNDSPLSAQVRGYQEIAVAIEAAFAKWKTFGSTSLFFSNPAYSHIVGVIGVWNQNELASVPGGRYLVGQNLVSPVSLAVPGEPGSLAATRGVSNADMRFATDDAISNVNPGSHASALTIPAIPIAPGATALPSTLLGPAVAEVNGNLLSIDLSSTIPEFGEVFDATSDLPKLDVGPLSVGVLDATGGFTTVGTISYDDYGEAAYNTTAGIVDVSLAGPLPPGTLAIQAQGITVLEEQPFTAQTDTRGIYLDEGGQTTFSIQVCDNGVPSPGANVMIARYGPTVQVPQSYGSLDIVPTGPTDPTGPVPQSSGPSAPSGQAELVVNFTTPTANVTVPGTTILTEVTTVVADDNGLATVGISAQTPGFMTLGFFPYAAGATPQDIPVPSMAAPASPSGQPAPPFNTNVSNWYYTAVRVLPFDDDLPQQFCDLWNRTHDQSKVWDFIYSPASPGGGILYLYDMVFNVMLEHVPLGEQQAVEDAAAQIWPLISQPPSSESSAIMPITRDLSAGKRLVLQLWLYLVLNRFPTGQELTVESINGFTPPGSPSR